MYESLGRFTTRRWKAVILAYFLLTLVFLWRGSSIRLETSLAELLPEDNRAARDFRDLLEEEDSLDRLLVSISLDPFPEDAEAALETQMAAAEMIAARLIGDGLARDARHGVGEEDLSLLTSRAIAHLPVLLDAGAAGEIEARLSDEAIAARVAGIGRRARMPGFIGPVEQMAARDPLGLLASFAPPAGVEGLRPDPATGLFLSRDGRRLLVLIEAAEPPTVIAFSRRLIGGLEEAEEKARARIEGGGALRFEHAGGHLFALEDERRIRHDATATSVISIAGIALVYLFVIRRPLLWLVVLVPMATTTIWTLGLASIYPGHLNMITVAFAAILLGIGDDAMIHMYLRERHERRQGLASPHSAVAALSATGRAITVATLTSAASFLSLAFVQFRGLAELGIISAIGMLALLVGVLVFFPAALTMLSRREEPASAEPLRLPLGAILAVHDWAVARRRAVLGVAAAGTVIMLANALQIEVSRDLRSIRGDDPAARALESLMSPYEGGASEMMVVLHGPRDAGRAGPAELDAALEEAERLRAWCAAARTEGLIAGCDAPSAIAPPRALQERRFDALGRLPWERAVARLREEASAAGMDPAFFEPFAATASRYGQLEAVRVDPEPGLFGGSGLPRTRIWLRGRETSAATAAAVREALGDPDARIASVALLSHELGGIVARDFRTAAVIVAAAVAILSFAAFRTVGILLVTLAPVALGTVWLLGIARLAGVELNLMSLMGMPVVFGLGVDYGVYLVDRWSRGERDPRAALAETGPALLVTGLTTLAGFAALLGAELQGLRSLGFAVVAGAGATLLAALVILPLLLPRGAPTPGESDREVALSGARAGAPAGASTFSGV